MTNSPASSPGDEPPPGLFELIFSESEAAPQVAEKELQRMEWAIRPTAMPGELSPCEVEEIEELRRELNSLQPPVPAPKGSFPVQESRRENVRERVPSPVAEDIQIKPRRWNQRLLPWIATAAALSGIATLLTFSIQPLREFVWNSAPWTESGKGASDPSALPTSEVERARQLVKVDYSLVHQAGTFLGDKWLVASRNAELEAGLSTAARTEAIDELDQVMEKLQQKDKWTSSEAISIGQWRLKRGEWGLAAQAFRTATSQQSDLTEAWVGLALTVARHNTEAGNSAELRQILSTWMETQSRMPDPRKSEHESQVRNELSAWIKATEKRHEP